MKIEYLTDEFRDDVTADEALEVIEDGEDYPMTPSKRGNDRVMYVGWTSLGRLLEVGVEFMNKTQMQVFHAMEATKSYRKLFGAK